MMMSVGCGLAPTWVLVVIVGFMMYVGCGPPPPGIFGIFIWYCDYDVMMSVSV